MKTAETIHCSLLYVSLLCSLHLDESIVSSLKCFLHECRVFNNKTRFDGTLVAPEIITVWRITCPLSTADRILRLQTIKRLPVRQVRYLDLDTTRQHTISWRRETQHRFCISAHLKGNVADRSSTSAWYVEHTRVSRTS